MNITAHDAALEIVEAAGEIGLALDVESVHRALSLDGPPMPNSQTCRRLGTLDIDGRLESLYENTCALLRSSILAIADGLS